MSEIINSCILFNIAFITILISNIYAILYNSATKIYILFSRILLKINV